MDINLWQKLARLARRGERVVVVENGEGFVLLPLDEYERLSNGEASLQRVAAAPVVGYQLPDAADFENPSVDEIIEDDLPPIPDLPHELDDEDEEEDSPLASVKTPIPVPLASDQLEEEERFYLEPIE